MELEVGMYIRTKWGIGKYIEDYTNSQNLTWRVLQGCSNYNNQEDWQNLFCDSEILKASHNIIDLIEVGDYVNGSKVIEISEYNGEKYVYVEETEDSNANQTDINIYYKNEDIETIVTKEQMEAMQYKVV